MEDSLWAWNFQYNVIDRDMILSCVKGYKSIKAPWWLIFNRSTARESFCGVEGVDSIAFT